MPASKKPFPLLSTFSVSSLLAIVLLVVGMNVTLGGKVEKELLERDKLITAATAQAEVLEYLAGKSFEQGYSDPMILRDILHSMMSMPGSFAVEFVLPDGHVPWSMLDGGFTSRQVDSPELSKAMQGEAVITREWFESKVYFAVDALFSTVLYIPIQVQNRVIGMLKLHRNNVLLKQQVQSLRQDVWMVCVLFGALLYGALMLIVVPASRILTRQHDELSDSTDQLQKINSELLRLQGQLLARERFATIGEVSAAVAHGLKNPLASLRAALQLLNMRKMDETERRELTKDLLAETDRLTLKLNNLLDYVRPFEPRFEHVRLRPLLEDTLKGLERESRQRYQTLHLEADAELPPISVDPVLLEEALLIVFTNAMQASSSGDSIECSLTRFTRPDEAPVQVITIRDHGKGIPESEMERIFDLFYSTRAGGTGLGLAICKKILDVHQGRVEFQSEPGRGTVCNLVLHELQRDEETV